MKCRSRFVREWSFFRKTRKARFARFNKIITKFYFTWIFSLYDVKYLYLKYT